MANLPLTGNSISSSYQGLLKSSDNTALAATEKPMVDGLGNASTLSMGTASASFTGTLDLSGATVTGLPTPGLVSGSALDSMESDASLTTNPANASGARAIAIGENASAASLSGIAIGRSANASGFQNALAFGQGATASADGSVALGQGVTAATADTVSVKALETQTSSTPTAGGIIMTDAGAVARRLNIDASGNLQIDSTPVGGGAAGLESGTGPSSMQSAASLTTIAATASANETIALGDGATASSGANIAIGDNANAGGDDFFDRANIAIGRNTIANNERCIAIGLGTDATGARAIALGEDAQATASRSMAFGQNANASGPDSICMGFNAKDNGASSSIVLGENANCQTNADDFSIVIGRNAQSTVSNGIAIGQDAQSDGTDTIMIGSGAAGTFNTVGLGISVSVNANESVAIGYDADVQTGSNNGIAIGVYSEVQTGNTNAIAIGQTASARAAGAVALGKQVIASKVDTVSVQALETQTDSTPTAGGIIMSDAGSTERRINITSTGDLQVDSNPVLVQTNAYATGGYSGANQGYGTTYWNSCSLTVGRPNIAGAMPDQGANVAMIIPFDVDYTKTINTIGVPMPIVTGNDTLYIGIYEGDSDGGPGTRVVYETKAITVADNNTWVEVALTSAWTPEKGKSYWIAAMTPGGNTASALGYTGGEAGTWQRFTTTNNSAVGTIISVQTLRVSTAGSLPTSYSSTAFSHRDEKMFLAWK